MKIDSPNKWHRAPGKTRLHWGILTLIDSSKLDRLNSSRRVKRPDQALKSLNNDASTANLEDFSI